MLAAVLATATACQDLQVDNLIAPDRERATANPTDVQAFIGGSLYPTFFTATHNTNNAVSLFMPASAEMTASLAGLGTSLQYLDLLEPRIEHNNGAVIPAANGPHGPRLYWAAIGRSASIPYDGLQILDDGMVITEGGVDVTPRARAFAKFMQAWSWGYTALIFDKVHVVHETQDIPTNPVQLAAFQVSTLVTADSAVKAAVSSLGEAVKIAQQFPNVVRYPSVGESALWFQSPTAITNAQFIQMANTLAARLMVLNARTPADRAKVDWPKVLQLTANGVQTDYLFELNSNRTSQVLQRSQNNTSGGETNARWNYRTIGPADQSGAYQKWIAAPPEQRDRFNIVTPDRRITGTTPTSNGTYTRYRADNNGFEVDRGKYFFSAYQWARHAIRNNNTGTANNVGSHPWITRDENNLLRAEALLRTGDPAGAAALINVTRTRTHLGSSLPPVTAAGVPTVAGQCVPRLDSGACGDLLAALRYERMVELAAMDAIRGYADSRGFGMLPTGSLLSFPVPGNVLELYGLDEYTYGGVGRPGTATYSPGTLP
jgi:hypothetical protein